MLPRLEKDTITASADYERSPSSFEAVALFGDQGTRGMAVCLFPCIRKEPQCVGAVPGESRRETVYSRGQWLYFGNNHSVAALA